MEWNKLGLVFRPDGNSAWAKHSALQPTPILQGNTLRVFCGFRDDDGVSRIGFVDLDATDPTVVLAVSQTPALDVGATGAFDSHGVVPCAVVQRGDEIYLYYAGYLRGETVRFQAFCGLAISQDGGQSFARYSADPILDRTPDEPLFRAIHSIFLEDGKWKTWYGAGSEFVAGKNKTLPVYNIRYMESEDGINFPSQGSVAIATLEGEHRVGRPYVVKQGNRYLMFFGKGKEDSPYQLTYAESPDGHSWTRCDDLNGLTLSMSGWDSQMMAYPALITVKESTYLFYNGNDYGKLGFGCAKLIAW
jgi:sucrose-6-phosphate hydrolase SacC (GH32 family)